MRIVHEPQVVLLARQTFRPEVWPEFIDAEGMSLGDRCVVARRDGGRVRWPGLLYVLRQRPQDQPRIYHNILDAKHGSVIEHAVWTLPDHRRLRSLTHELIRHRAGFIISSFSNGT